MGITTPITYNKIYKFTFPSRFSMFTGIYRVNDISIFENDLANDVDFVKSLYTPAGLTDADFQTDSQNYAGSLVYTLTPPQGGAEAVSLYVPAALLEVNPDPSVAMYDQVYLDIPLGIFASASDYAFIKQEVDDLASVVTGNPNSSVFMANPKNRVWLTQSEYDAKNAERLAKVTKADSLSMQLRKANVQIAELTARCRALEAIVLANKLGTLPKPVGSQ